jgi:phosphate-selective porin OprO and OprP
MRTRAWLLASLCVSAPAAAQTKEDFTRLMARLEEQQVQIERLQARLDALEPGRSTATADSARVAVAHADQSAARPQRTPAPLGQPQPSLSHPPSLDARLAQIEKAQSQSAHVDWSKGTPEFASADGSLTFRPRGRVQLDLGRTSGSDLKARDITATQARSLRLGFEGSVGKHLSYVLEGDFADNAVAIKSAYLAWTTGFMGQQAEFALGNRLNDRSLDGSSGTISVPFIERNLVAQAIIPVRGFFGLGAAARVYGDGWHVGVQASGDEVTNPGVASDTFTVAGRAHWNPIKTSAWLVHVGGWGFYERLAGDVTRPTRAVAIGGFFNDNLRVLPGTLVDPETGRGYGFEAGAFHRSLWAYGEYGTRSLNTRAGLSTNQDAWAVATGWFLTGESPPYLARGGVWSRPKVLHPFIDNGSGAIELAARYEEVDYSDNPTAGRGTALTFGINWYLNNFVRLQLNGIDWTTANPTTNGRLSDHGQTVVGRAQIAF